MSIRVTLEVLGTTQIDRTLARFTDRLDDARPLWEDLANRFAAIEAQQFDTEGAAGSAGWPALSADYGEWKSNVRPGAPILVFDGHLRRSLTSRPFGVERITAHSIEVGTNVPYAAFHQHGNPATNLPKRPPVHLTEGQRRAWVARIQRYVVRGE